MAKKNYLVTNRSSGRVAYALPELGIQARQFEPGETKKLSEDELTALSYIPGGIALMREYLQVQDEEIRNDLVGHTEPEYNMSQEDVKKLILTGSQDEWLDCLDFAPEGVIDLIRNLSIELPLTDTNKMNSFKEKKGYDLARAIQVHQEELAAAAAEKNNTKKTESAAPERRVKVEETTVSRRTTGSKYKIVNKEE